MNINECKRVLIEQKRTLICMEAEADQFEALSCEHVKSLLKNDPDALPKASHLLCKATDKWDVGEQKDFDAVRPAVACLVAAALRRSLSSLKQQYIEALDDILKKRAG